MLSRRAAARLRRALRWLGGALVLLPSLVASETPAWAHDPFEITTAGTLRSAHLDLVVTMTRPAAGALLKAVGAPLSPNAPSGADLGQAAEHLYEVTWGNEELPPTAASAVLSEEGEVEFRLRYLTPASGRLRLHAIHLALLPTGYGTAISLSREEPRTTLALKYLTSSDPLLEAEVPGLESNAPTEDRSEEQSRDCVLSSFFALGVEHIVLGYDHLLLLAGLLMGCRRLRSMLGLVSCFTVAHSASLALAVFQIVHVPAWLVEPAIAASIVLVGAQNLADPAAPPHRYALTFGIGLLHGLGFAGALTGLGLQDAASRALPLLWFNLGVEVGQACIAAVFLPVWWKLRGLPAGPRIARALSLLICLLGAYWFVERVGLPPEPAARAIWGKPPPAARQREDGWDGGNP